MGDLYNKKDYGFFRFLRLTAVNGKFLYSFFILHCQLFANLLSVLQNGNFPENSVNILGVVVETNVVVALTAVGEADVVEESTTVVDSKMIAVIT